MTVREALREFRESLVGIPPEHLNQESLFFLADQIDRLERKIGDEEK